MCPALKHALRSRRLCSAALAPASAPPQADIQRDQRGSYWETARRTDAVHGYQADSLWYRDVRRGDVRAMVRGSL